jgi:hypothetical protein
MLELLVFLVGFEKFMLPDLLEKVLACTLVLVLGLELVLEWE